MEYTAYSFVMDFAFMSLLLIVAQFLRSKFKPLQIFYIPSSLIAGLMGLLLGPQVLNIIPWSGQVASYAYLLICVMFGGLFLGNKEKVSLRKIVCTVGDTFCVNMAAEFLCFGLALLVGGGMITLLFPNVFTEIALLLPSGFCGGHGYASTIGTALNNLLGRTDCVSIGQAFATIGLLVGLIGGIICINFAARHSATRLIQRAEALPEECRTGLVPVGKRPSMGEETINPMSMDPLAWHMSLTLLATLMGYSFYNWYKQYLPEIEIPIMCLTMMAGIVVQTILNHTPFRDSVDKHVEGRIGSTVTDYLVGFGVASISLTIVQSYALPILVLSILGIAWPLFLVFFVGKKLFHNFWFERSIFIFGWITGVVATGTTLVRVVDPENKSKTLDDFGTAYALQSVIEVFIVALTPQFVVLIGWGITGAVLSAVGVALLLLCANLLGVYHGKMDQLREGEEGLFGRPN